MAWCLRRGAVLFGWPADDLDPVWPNLVRRHPFSVHEHVLRVGRPHGEELEVHALEGPLAHLGHLLHVEADRAVFEHGYLEIDDRLDADDVVAVPFGHAAAADAEAKRIRETTWCGERAYWRLITHARGASSTKGTLGSAGPGDPSMREVTVEPKSRSLGPLEPLSAEGPLTSWRAIAAALGKSDSAVLRARRKRGDKHRPWFASADEVREWWQGLHAGAAAPAPKPKRSPRKRTRVRGAAVDWSDPAL